MLFLGKISTVAIVIVIGRELLKVMSDIYRISSLIRRCFFSFQNNPKNLDLSYKTDLDLWDCLGRVKLAKLHRTDLIFCTHSREGKTPSYSQINTVCKTGQSCSRHG